jgi:hypothetical protein
MTVRALHLNSMLAKHGPTKELAGLYFSWSGRK